MDLDSFIKSNKDVQRLCVSLNGKESVSCVYRIKLFCVKAIMLHFSNEICLVSPRRNKRPFIIIMCVRCATSS